jgi:hypothetical protein
MFLQCFRAPRPPAGVAVNGVQEDEGGVRRGRARSPSVRVPGPPLAAARPSCSADGRLSLIVVPSLVARS